MKEDPPNIVGRAQHLNYCLRDIDSKLRVDVHYPYVTVLDEIPPDNLLSETFLEYVKCEEINFEYEEKVTKFKPGPVRGQLNWKSSNRGPVRLKPSKKTKNEGPVRQYKSVKEDGFTRPNKPKNPPPKGTIVGIFTGV
jgi:hypothetical protein